jgi:hypothetical protein
MKDLSCTSRVGSCRYGLVPLKNLLGVHGKARNQMKYTNFKTETPPLATVNLLSLQNKRRESDIPIPRLTLVKRERDFFRCHESHLLAEPGHGEN